MRRAILPAIIAAVLLSQTGTTQAQVKIQPPLGGSGSGISAVVDDTTPQLGGDLDTNGNDITDVSDSEVNLTVPLVVNSNGTAGDPAVAVSGQRTVRSTLNWPPTMRRCPGM